MKLTSIEVHPAGSDMIAVLSFRDPGRQNPYNVKNVVGLDSDEIIARYYGASGNSTDKFYNLVVQNRDVVMQVELNPNFSDNKTYSDLRDDLYRMIASSRTGLVELWFKNGDTVVAVLSGYITKLETDQFVKIPEATITLRTKDPVLKAPTRTDETWESVDPLVVVDDISTAPHGFIMQFTFNGASEYLLISDPPDSAWFFEIRPISGFLDDDVLYLSSESDNKYLYIMRASTQIHLADRILPGSIWPILFPGTNTFSFDADVAPTLDSLVHYHTYFGV